MKRKIVLYIAILLVSSSLFSCNDFLTEKQYDFIGPDLIGDSEAGKEYWINGIYYTFNDSYFRYGGYHAMWELDNDDISGPPWAMSAVGAGSFQGFWAADVVWTGPYQVIHRSNQAMLKIENMASLTSDSKEDALGQIYFLRAFAYFQLVRAYGAVPIHRLPVSVGGTNPHQPRSSVKDVYALIIEDLKKAETMMYSNKNNSYKKGRPAKAAASLLLAKVYVTIGSGSAPAGTRVSVLGGPAVIKEGDVVKKIDKPTSLTHSKEIVAGYEEFDSKEYFRLAKEKSWEVINCGEYDLFDNYMDTWQASNKNGKEHVFSLQAIPIDEVLGNTVAYDFIGIMDPTTMNRIEAGWYGLRNHWYEIFEEKDKRIVEGVFHRWTWPDAKGQYRYYPQKDSTKVRLEDPAFGYKKEDSFIDDVNSTAKVLKFLATTQPKEKRTDYNYPWLRFVEALLIYAEADNEYNGGPSTEAYTQLNRVRSRCNVDDAPVMDQQAFRSFVLEERRRELALEGNRRWDLIRWGIYLPVMNAIDIDENNVVKRRERKHLLFPIPVSEIDSNNSINENNPGW